METMSTAVRRYSRSLGIDAYVVGGAVRDELLGIPHRDEDFLVPGVDQQGLRALLAPHGRIEDMEVHGQLVGVRFHPRGARLPDLPRAGIELTPPRAERSTGPGHLDFAIVADPGVSLEQDMARRDFTINAMARRLETGELIDPFGGVEDLERRELRTVSPRSFREDPLRILRGLRLVSQLGFDLADETVAQMRAEAPGLRHVSGERIGGGVDADGMGELSRLLLGNEPVRALRLARDTGALVAFLPEFEAAIGYRTASERQPDTLDEHLFAVVGETVALTAPLSVRLAGLVHDLGKPETDRRGGAHAAVGSEIAGRILRRLRYPTLVRRKVVALVAAHAFRVEGGWRGERARRFLAEHGWELAGELTLLKRADLAVKRVPDSEREAVSELRKALDEERGSPHRVRDLAVNGGDLIGIGFAEGPELGRVLHVLLDLVLTDPALNHREVLVDRAREELPR
jgi:poly(A) polymerase/tRNA nucleotidyltransferase (CCA-adding enzyme)